LTKRRYIPEDLILYSAPWEPKFKQKESFVIFLTLQKRARTAVLVQW
jgi:hypothetical protein